MTLDGVLTDSEERPASGRSVRMPHNPRADLPSDMPSGGFAASLVTPGFISPSLSVPRLVRWVAGLRDRQLATLLGGVLALVGAWPLFFLRLAPYQDLPDHLATVCVLLNPERYPEFISNGWLKSNSALVTLLYLLAKGLGVLAAGRIVPVLVVAATAFALTHFVLAFTDRRRLVVASVLMAPMVHNWGTRTGMLNFSLGIALGLVLLAAIARQAERPTRRRGLVIAGASAVLWYIHGLVLLFVGLLSVIEVVARREPGSCQMRTATSLGRWRDLLRAKLFTARDVLLPLLPMGLVTLGTIVHHRQFGHVDLVEYEPAIRSVYNLWAHWFLGMGFATWTGVVNAIVLAYFAAKGAKRSVPMFSIWTLAVLAAFYFFLPLTIPGVGFLCERALPFLWVWALVRVPSRLSPWTWRALLASTAAWSIGLGVDLYRGGADLDDFSAAAPLVPPGARLMALNFEPHASATNTWCLIHASGMYTVLSGAHPLDLWADSTSMPIMRRRPPQALVEDPVRIREFEGVAYDRRRYCEALEQAGFSDIDCAARWTDAWHEFWGEASPRYDYVLLWWAPKALRATIPPEYTRRMVRGPLELYVRAGMATAEATATR